MDQQWSTYDHTSIPSPPALESSNPSSLMLEEGCGPGVAHRREVSKKAREKQGKTFQRLVAVLGKHRTSRGAVKGRSNQLIAMLDLFE